MQNLSSLALTWLQLDSLAGKLKGRDQETLDLANAAVAMARKQYKESLSAYWNEQIEIKLREDLITEEIEELLSEGRKREEP